MSAHEGLPHLRELILFLCLSGVLIPLLQRRSINPVLGFLAVGTLVGPYGLGRLVEHWPWLATVTFARVEDVAVFAELGVIFLMFMIGLEMSVDRLWALRRWVFGVGALQVGLSAAAIGGLAYVFGNPVEASVILGLVLAFSSTAVVMQLLTLRRELGTPLGQASFSLLLFQDLAVVPLLVLVGLLGQHGDGSFALQMGQAAMKGVVTIGAIYLIGRRLVQPVFHHLAANQQSDTFMALTLLVSLGVAALTWAAGLSMAMGALLAGLIIAETEFRHAVEVTIEPFKGLLMGLFFMSVGMGIDLTELINRPLWLPLSVVGLVLIKGLVIAALFRGFGLSMGRAIEGGMLLGAGGEFAFIVIGMALTYQLLPRDVAQFMLLVVGLSMLATPLIARIGQSVGNAIDRRTGQQADATQVTDVASMRNHVILAGYGRVGRLVGELLSDLGVAYCAIESSPAIVARYRARGLPVVFGDASNPEMLRRLHLDQAGAVILTMDQTAPAIHAVRGLRAMAPDIHVLARARDEKHALALRKAGADIVIPETLESSLQLAAGALARLGVPDEAARLLLERARDDRTHPLRNTS
ncbi:cation:proton antiporter [Denitromonas sp.]|uniref:cation:proton antiporter domain-containing protein n=1 Tax=Denitromonas sp. TaxID=2734609 RepID=UPI003A8B4DC7